MSELVTQMFIDKPVTYWDEMLLIVEWDSYAHDYTKTFGKTGLLI